MRTQEDRLETPLRALAPADEIAGRVDSGFEASLGKATRQPFTAVREESAQRPAGIGLLGIRYGGERHDVVPRATGVNWKIRRHGRRPQAAARGRTKRPLPGSASTRPSEAAHCPRSQVSITR